MNLTVKDIIKICNGTLYCGSENVICLTFTKDTRTITKGDTYIGIKGQNFNGNDFYEEAFLKGANCAILEKQYFKATKNLKEEKPIILVDDIIKALKDIASYIRNQTTAYIIGVTGSVGKTSTRDMIYSVLTKNFKTLKTLGNFNNNIGLPLTIMRLKDEQAAVIEMGMNHLGEIDYLTKIARPHISVITNVGTAHIGEVGSRENILKAKLEICHGMDEDGKLIINNDNDLLHDYYLKNKKNIVTIGIDNPSDFMATNINLAGDYSTFQIKYNDNFYDVYCPVPGKAFIYNSLVAFAVGSLLKIAPAKIVAGIKDFELTKNRLEFIKVKNNVTIINDAYNASVDSMKSSLDILKNYPSSRKIAVLGSMLELGDYANSLHEQIGRFLVQNNIDILVTVGTLARFIAQGAIDELMPKENIYVLDNNQEAIELLKELIKPNDAILIKASNSLKFSEIVEALKEFEV